MEWNDLWPLIVTTIVGTIIGFVVTLIMTKAQKEAENKVQENREEKQERELEHIAMRESCKAFLRRVLKDDFEFYKKIGYCSVDDKSEVDDLYNLYHTDLKGNGRGTRYYEAIMALPDTLEELEDEK